MTDNTIDSLPLSNRTKNILKRAEVNTLNKLTNYSIKELLELVGLGAKGTDEIAKALAQVGLRLKDDEVLEAGVYIVSVTRISYGNKDIRVKVDQPISIEELKALGEKAAYDEAFSEKSSEYEVKYIQTATGKVIN